MLKLTVRMRNYRLKQHVEVVAVCDDCGATIVEIVEPRVELVEMGDAGATRALPSHVCPSDEHDCRSARILAEQLAETSKRALSELAERQLRSEERLSLLEKTTLPLADESDGALARVSELGERVGWLEQDVNG